MNKDFEINQINECVSDDGWYWDNYCQFDYGGKSYTYLEVGSKSGYIVTSFYFVKGKVNRLFGNDYNRNTWAEDLRDFRYLNENKIPKLINYLEKSGKDHLEFSEGENEDTTDEKFLKILGYGG